uniref:Uncharacterized protein n=1 Tax=Caenorhabditis japonica TaxID=281687 RepID=A0A8R1EQG6_CAEJA
MVVSTEARWHKSAKTLKEEEATRKRASYQFTDTTPVTKRRCHNDIPSRGHRCAFCRGHLGHLIEGEGRTRTHRRMLEEKDYCPQCIHPCTRCYACRPKACYYCEATSHHSSLCLLHDL